MLSSLHKPRKDSHKGKNGKLLVIGGGSSYSGCSMLNLLAARRFVDLLYYYPAENDPFLVQAVKTIPEAMVVYDFEKVRDVDCVLVAGGIESEVELDISWMQDAKKIVLDASAFNFIKRELVDNRFILTPHVLEFERYFAVQPDEKNVFSMAKKYNCSILLKGTPDIISNGRNVHKNNIHNAGMTKGGTGDVLAGFVAALSCTNGNFESAVAGAYLNGLAGNMLQKKFGFNFCASDLTDRLAEVHAKATKQI